MKKLLILTFLLSGAVSADEPLPTPSAKGWIASARIMAQVDNDTRGPGEVFIRLALVATGSGANEDARGALLPAKDGELDLSNFRIFRVTAMSPATGKLLRGEELDLVAAARIENLGQTPTCTEVRGEALPVEEIDLHLRRSLAPDEVYAIYVEHLQHPSTCEIRRESRAESNTVFSPSAIADSAAKDHDRYVLVTADGPIGNLAEISLVQVVTTAAGVESEIPLPSRAAYTSSSADVASANFNSVRIYPERRFKQGVTYEVKVKGLRSHLAPIVAKTAEFKGTFGSPPKGKDDSAYYSKLFGQVSDSEKPIFTADVKIAPDGPSLGRGWYFDPEFEADIGSDNSKAKNRILLKPVFSLERTFEGRNLAGILVDLALPSLETDKDFDKRNTLMIAEIEPRFRGWFDTREMRAEAQRIDKATSIAPAISGYGVELRLGAELGRSDPANGGLVENKAKTQSVTVPDHDVARFRIYGRAFYEWHRLVFELKLDYRYLFSDETVADLDSATDVVSLRTEDGLKGLATIGLAWVLDDEQHYALGIEYQNGESPPNYREIDTAKVSLVLKY